MKTLTARLVWALLSALSLALAPVAAAGEPHIFGGVGIYVPENAGDSVCGVNGCLELESGLGFQGGIGYDVADFAALEVGGLYSSGDFKGTQGAPNGDWTVNGWLTGVRLQTPEMDKDYQFFGRVGAFFWNAEVDIAGVNVEDDGTEVYFGAGGRYKYVSASWWHSDGDNMFTAGVEIPLSL